MSVRPTGPVADLSWLFHDARATAGAHPAAPATRPSLVGAATPASTPAREATVAGQPDDDVEATHPAAPPPAHRAALYPEAPVVVVLTWDDGARMAVYGRTRYGRNPAPASGAVAVAVRDETLSLSKEHFEIGGDTAGAWVTDLHSTNGTVLVRDGHRIPLTPGLPTTLRPGDGLELGDRRLTVGASR